MKDQKFGFSFYGYFSILLLVGIPLVSYSWGYYLWLALTPLIVLTTGFPFTTVRIQNNTLELKNRLLPWKNKSIPFKEIKRFSEVKFRVHEENYILDLKNDNGKELHRFWFHMHNINPFREWLRKNVKSGSTI